MGDLHVDRRWLVSPRHPPAASPAEPDQRQRARCARAAAAAAARRHARQRDPLAVEEEAAEWQAVARALLAHKRRGLARTKHVYLLEGIARCGHCGGPIAIRSGQRVKRWYSPAAYVCRARKFDGTCTAPIVRCPELDDRVWAALRDELEQPDLLRALAEVDVERALAEDATAWESDAAGFRSHLARLDKVEGAIMIRFRRGQVSEGALDAELDAIGRERKMLRQQLAAAEKAAGAAMSSAARQRAAISTVQRLRAALPIATPEQRRALLRELAHDGGVVIRDGSAHLDLRLLRMGEAESRDAGGEGARLVLAEPPGYRKSHEAILRIRRVA
jgi:hypothetical protein